MDTPQFELWLEFEWWVLESDDDPTTNFFNMQITLPNAQRYGLNVWTYNYFTLARQQDQASAERLGGAYLLPPDLFVERLDRRLLEQIIADLIRTHQLREAWLIREDADTFAPRNAADNPIRTTDGPRSQC